MLLQLELLLLVETHVGQSELAPSENSDQYVPANSLDVGDILSDVGQHFEGKEDEQSLSLHQIILMLVVIEQSRLLACLLEDHQLFREQAVDFDHDLL